MTMGHMRYFSVKRIMRYFSVNKGFLLLIVKNHKDDYATYGIDTLDESQNFLRGGGERVCVATNAGR